jgi:hypothetical protein
MYAWPLVALGLAGCGGGAASSDDGGFQACYTTYAEPVLALSGVADSVSGASVRSVIIAGVTVQGVQVDPFLLTSTSSNVTASGGELVCQLPCGFSNLEGQYRFTVKSAGYQDRVVAVAAAYARFTGTCVTTFSGSTSVSLQLTPQ